MSGASSPREPQHVGSPRLRAVGLPSPVAEEDGEGTFRSLTEVVTSTTETQNSFHQNDGSLEADGETFTLDIHTHRPIAEGCPTESDSEPTDPVLPAHITSDLGILEMDLALPKRTPSKLRSFFRRPRSSTLEVLHHITRPNSIRDPTSPNPTSSASLSPAPSYIQYIGHSAEQSESSYSVGSSISSYPSTIDTTAEPWHLSKTAKNLMKGVDLSIKNPNVMFASPMPACSASGQHSNSTDHTATVESNDDFSMPAATGDGLKARTLNTSLPGDFDVDTVELHDEYTSGSIMPGRRGKLVGRGSTATVKLMIRKTASTEKIFAVKEFRKKGLHESEDEYVKKVKSEYTIARSLHHPNIVKSVRLCTHGGRWNHVMEFCSQGEVFTLVQKNYLTLEDDLCLFKQLLRGVAHLHAHGIAHRDIKLENLLMTSEGHLKISDFGVSEVFCGEHPGLRSTPGFCGKDMDDFRLCAPGICGSLPYIAPEVVDKTGKYDPRALDVWSCAIVLMCMIYKGNPWPAADHSHPHQNYARFLSGWDTFIDKHPDGLITGAELPSCGPLFSKLPRPTIKSLLLRMMHPNPNKRITIHEAVDDRWVKGIECCCLEDYGEGTRIDAREKGCMRVVKRVGIRKKHNHLPPRESRLPSGLGWS